MITCTTLSNYLKVKFKTSLQLWEKSRNTPSEINIHDLRVSLRRLIAILNFSIFLYENQPKYQKRIKKIRKQVKCYLSSMSKLRDLQVQILSIQSQELVSDYSLLYLEYLQQKEQELLEELPSNLEKWHLKELKKKCVNTLHKRPVKNREIEMKTYLYLHYLTDRLHSVIDKTNEQPASYHKVRIALKKYRYYLEFLEKAFQLKQGLLPYLKQWQDRLGHFQDLYITLQHIEKMNTKSYYDHVMFQKQYLTEMNDLIPTLKQDLYELKFKTQY